MLPSCVMYTLMEAAYCHSGQSFYLRNANLTVNTELPFIIFFNTDDLGSSDSEHVMVPMGNQNTDPSLFKHSAVYNFYTKL